MFRRSRQRDALHSTDTSNANGNSQESSSMTIPKPDKQEIEFSKIFGFNLKDLSSWQNIVRLLYRPTDPASLGVVRALFGLLMVLDIPEERGLARADIRWGDPLECRFPLFNFLQPLPLQWMCIVYLVMWLGAAGIMLGLFFRLSCLAYAVTYWYIFLLDKSSWNNHSYLFGLLALLLLPSQANQYCSLDALLWPSSHGKSVPLWNYAILRYQLAVLYFLAGLKKIDVDWLNGYSMTHLANHWVFEPFKLVLSTEQVDLWIVHRGGFFLDLTISFWLFFDQTRIPAMFFCGMFHLMNSQIFTIGMFPYVCLATQPLFCSPDWPRRLKNCLYHVNKTSVQQSKPTKQADFTAARSSDAKAEPPITWCQSLVVVLLATHVGAQAFLPYSHFITQGYNNWTNGLYGYSWDMMVHTWDTVLVMARVVDQTTGEEHFLDPEAWVQTDRWCKHTDMVVQWAHCLQHNLQQEQSMEHISVHLDVWSSLNGRFQQRMYDPRIDLLDADWSPLRRPSWAMPLMTELSSWRQTMSEIEKHVFSWSNHSDVLFVADFPGLALENYIAAGMSNVSLTVLSGEVVFEQLGQAVHESLGQEVALCTGQSVSVHSEAFHHVHTVSEEPACYMYTFNNKTAMQNKQPLPTPNFGVESPRPLHHLRERINNFVTALSLVWNAVLHLLFSVPVPRRVRLG